MCNSYRKFCLREPSQVLRNANCFKSYLLPVHPTPHCMPKNSKPWQRAIQKMQLPLVKAPLRAEDHRGEQDAREKYCSQTVRSSGVRNFCSSHTPTLSRSYCSANCRYRNYYNWLHYNYDLLGHELSKPEWKDSAQTIVIIFTQIRSPDQHSAEYSWCWVPHLHVSKF